MVRLLVTRLATAAVTLLAISILVFAAIRAIPGSYVDLILGPYQTPEGRARATQQYALDGSVVEQFFGWIGQVVRGDLGVSLVTKKPVLDELVRRMAPTAQLTLMATTMAVGAGVPLGVAAAVANERRAVRALSRAFGAACLSVPDFVLGTLCVYVFSRWSLGVTVGGYVPFFDDPITNLKAMALPAFVLGVFGVGIVMRTTRDAVLATVAEPTTTAFVARGERPATIVVRHVLRNSAIQVVTVVVTFVAYLLGGTVIIETLFSVPGVGVYIVSAIDGRDYAVLQGGVLLASAVFVVLNMLSDIAYALIDPRLTARTGLS